MTEKLSLRHVDTSVDISPSLEVTLRREGDDQTIRNKFSRMIKIKMDHPTNENLKLELKVGNSGWNFLYGSGPIKYKTTKWPLLDL